MDFWSRLLAHTPLSSGNSRRDAAKDPVRRLYKFEKEYSQLLQVWRNTSNIVRDADAAEGIEIRVQELTNILTDESRRPLPHPCITFAATKQVYIPIAKIATTSYNEWIIKEAVFFFATLVESEEEAFVENDAFSASLTNLLVRITGANSIRLGSDTEVKVVELAFNITTKIRLDPEILPAWFRSRTRQTPPANNAQQEGSREKFTGKAQKQDFPLFYLLIDYIHHEGRIGDFARTGLLYIIESASSSVDLEQWIVESDLSTLMATGLGALYSQLSRKLVIDHPPDDLPPVLAFSDYQHPKPTYEIVSSCDPDFQAHLGTFLSHLLFWQDVMNHCRSVEVKQTLLEHFQVIFLEQLLYPSLLESSDIDGGSSVAVLTYLRRILEALDHPDMINLILHYLLDLPDLIASSPSSTRDPVSVARRRKSMDLATMMAAKAEVTATPLLFNLVDLIQACLRSQSEQTIHVTLQLVSAILRRHHRYAVITLLRTEGVHGDTSHRTIGAHQQEVEYLMSLAENIGGQDNFDEIYDNVLRDTVVRLEGHPCSIILVAPRTSANSQKLPAIPDSLPGAPGTVKPHTLRPDDPILNTMLDRLETFFINPIETNLSLTETILDLGVCGFIHVEGWLLRNPERYGYEDGDDEEPVDAEAPPREGAPDPTSPSYAEFQKMQSISRCHRRPIWTASSLPRLLAVLETLSNQVDAYRESIPRFDDLLQLRREAFQIADHTEPEQAPMPVRTKNPASPPHMPGPPALDRTSLDESRSSSPARPSALEGFAQRILSEFGTPSRSGSPRGRKELSRTPALGPQLPGGQGFSTPTPSKPAPVPPKELPMNYDTPTRRGIHRSYSPNRERGEASSWDGRDGPVSGQTVAFQAIDQSILSRQVGIPASKVLPVPLELGKPKNKELESAAASSDEPEQETKQAAAAATESKAETIEEGQAAQESESESEQEQEQDNTGDVTLSDVGDIIGPVQEEKTVSVSHVLTNVIVLQSFLFELASLVQVRAGLFDEVRFA